MSKSSPHKLGGGGESGQQMLINNYNGKWEVHVEDPEYTKQRVIISTEVEGSVGQGWRGYVMLSEG